ncbi:hypothetical protein ACV3U8_12145 [Clostridium perfringens]
MMRYIDNNPMYQDHITGLIGASGTHQLLIFWILLTVVNLFKLYNCNKLRYKLLIIFEFIFMAFISYKNDNTAFYIVFAVIVLQYMIKDLSKLKFKNICKYSITILTIVLLAMTLYNTNKNFEDFYNDRIYSKLVAYRVIDDETKAYNGQGDERIDLYRMALEVGNGYKLGKGIGSIKSYGDLSLDKHFGMSEISLRVYEGGLIYFISLIFIFTYFLYRILFFSKLKLGIIAFIIVFIDVLILAIYTTVFRISIFSLVLSLLSCMVYYKYSDNNLNKLKE